MGCFNLHGFYSHLPITYGDKVAAIVCGKIDNRVNAPMTPIDTGFIPLMAPVYGTYDDYGGIENIKDSVSVEAFKSLTGYSLAEFMDALARNGDVSITTKDNYNPVDDVPRFQKMIKNLIPKECRDECLKWRGINVDDDADECMKAYAEQRLKIMNSMTFTVIIEHEAIVNKLIEIGGRCIDRDKFAQTYDDIIACIGNECTIFSNLALLTDKFLNKIDLNKISEGNESAALSAAEASKKAVEIYSKAFLSQAIYVPETIKYEEIFGVVYRNQQIDNMLLKNDVMNLILLFDGMKCMGGTFSPSPYGGQELYLNDMADMQNMMQTVTNEIVKKYG